MGWELDTECRSAILEPRPGERGGSPEYMERVSRWARGHQGPFSKAEAREGTRAKLEKVRDAVDELVAEGYLKRVDGGFEHVRDYHQDDSTDQASQAAWDGEP